MTSKELANRFFEEAEVLHYELGCFLDIRNLSGSAADLKVHKIEDHIDRILRARIFERLAHEALIVYLATGHADLHDLCQLVDQEVDDE